MSHALCANPMCANPPALGKSGRPLMYCENPNCRKQAWYYRHISRNCRETIFDKLDRLEQKLSQQPLPFSGGSQPNQLKPVGTGQVLSAKNEGDDSAFNLQIRTSAPDPDVGKRVGENLIRSLWNLQGGKPPQPVGTGLALSANTGPKPMSVPQFTAPNFDDLEDIPLSIHGEGAGVG